MALVVVAGMNCRKPAPGGGSFAAALFVPGVVVEAAHSSRRTAVSEPICPAGHSTHRRTARSRPGHSRSHNTADRIDCRSLHAVAGVVAVAAAGRVVGVPDRNIAAVAAGAAASSCRTAVAGTPWREEYCGISTENPEMKRTGSPKPCVVYAPQRGEFGSTRSRRSCSWSGLREGLHVSCTWQGRTN